SGCTPRSGGGWRSARTVCCAAIGARRCMWPGASTARRESGTVPAERGLSPRRPHVASPRDRPYARTMDIDTNLVVVDIVAIWTIDAALFSIAGLGFLAWGIALRGAGRSLAAFAIELAVCLVVERVATTLHRADRLESASPLPAGARRGSIAA